MIDPARRLCLARAAAWAALPLVGGCTFAAAFPPPRVRVARAGPIELPCRIAPGGLVLLRGRVDGRGDVEFVLDTGAPITVLIDGPRSAALGLDSRDARKLGPEDDPAVPVGVIRAGLEVDFDGQLTLSGLSAVVIPQASLACPERIDRIGFAGVIGADLMRRFVVEIDTRAGRVRLVEPAHFQPPPGHAALPLHTAQGHHFVDAALQAGDRRPSVPLRLHVDSGKSSALMLRVGSHPAIVLPRGLERGEACFVAGLRPVWRGGAPLRLGFGDWAIEVERPDYAEAADSPMRRGTHQGAIGMPLLARHAPVVDVPGARLWLRRAPLADG